MKPAKSPQERMDAAFDNYFDLSNMLTEDLRSLLSTEVEEQHWRRNFIRASAALFEGYAHCLRQMCVVSFECEAPSLKSKEISVLRHEGSFDSADRIRLTLRAAYKLSELVPAPTFGGQGWANAQHALLKRHALMHPKTPSDLSVEDEHWIEFRNGIVWLMEQYFEFFNLLYNKHSNERRRNAHSE